MQRGGAVLQPTISFAGGQVRIDPVARQLFVGKHPARLGSRAFDLLAALVERREGIVSKQELLDAVWPGLVVEENNLQVQVMTLRKLLGADAIVTVSGRGYRWTLRPDDSAAAAPALPAPGADDGLLGQDGIVAEVLALFDAGTPLVTLTGPGGAGKTRIAQRIAAVRGRELACWFVMLAPARDVAQFWAALAGVLGVQESGATPLPDLVRAWLAPRRALVVLDNLEHLPEVAGAVVSLCAACPRVQWLATSRTVLHVTAEQVQRVPPLADEAAAELFARRAAGAGRPLADDERAIASQVCRQLDGLPLAIELAAARLRVLSPAALAARLGQRLALLKGGPADAPDRQKTLRDTIAWSHDLLPPEAQSLFRRLGVFVGGWSLEAAEAIDDEPLTTVDRLELLLDHNLVQRLDDVEGTPRYAMLETLREFAIEKLEAGNDTAALRDRHAGFFTRQAASAERHITSGARVVWLNRLRADLANQRAALGWAVREQRSASAALALAATLGWPWYFFGLFQEGRQWIAEALALDGGAESDRAAALAGAARLATYAGDLTAADRLAAQAAEHWRRIGDRRGLAHALFNRSIPFAMRGDFATSCSMLGEALGLFESLADPWGQALATGYLGASSIMAPCQESRARALLLEGHARCAALDDAWGTTFCSFYLGLIAMRAQNYETALALTEEALVYTRSVGDSYRIARNLHQMGEAQWLLGRKADGLRAIAESVGLNVEHRRLGDIAAQMRLLTRFAADAGADHAAVRCAALAARHAAEATTLPPDDRAAHAVRVQALRKRVAPDPWAAHWLAGQMLDADDMPALFDEIGRALL
jgi:predicted ATPase/DNA-binding winged helix-turn-helix (wHTH) protein